jgi:hypothetical protein
MFTCSDFIFTMMLFGEAEAGSAEEQPAKE